MVYWARDGAEGGPVVGVGGEIGWEGGAGPLCPSKLGNAAVLSVFWLLMVLLQYLFHIIRSHIGRLGLSVDR